MSKIKTAEELAVDFYESKGWYVEDEPYEFAKFYHEYAMKAVIEVLEERKIKALKESDLSERLAVIGIFEAIEILKERI